MIETENFLKGRYDMTTQLKTTLTETEKMAYAVALLESDADVFETLDMALECVSDDIYEDVTRGQLEGYFYKAGVALAIDWENTTQEQIDALFDRLNNCNTRAERLEEIKDIKGTMSDSYKMFFNDLDCAGIKLITC